MKKLAGILGLSLLSVVALAQEGGETIVLTIDGKEYSLQAGEELKLEGSYSAPTISARIADNKRFVSKYLEFDYPKNFSYTFDEDIGYRNWTLDGSDFVIMYFEMDVETPMDLFVEEMVNQFGEWRCKTSPTQLTLGSRTLEGTRLDVTLVGQQLSIDFVEIEGNAYKSRIIAFQDTIGDDGKASAEKIKTLNVIDKSINYSPK